MELALERVKPLSKTVVKEVTMAVAITIGYFTLCVINPFQSVTAFLSLTLPNVRIAEALRPLSLRSLGAVAGISTGAWMYNLYTGKALLGVYPAIPVIMGAIWTGVHFASKAWGKSYKKDLTLVALGGLATGLLVTLHLTSLAILLQGSVWSEALKFGALWKIASHVIVPVMSYMLFNSVKGLYEANRNSK